MIDDIAARRTELQDLCRRFGVRRLDVFGSAARGDFDPGRSDIDFLYESNPSPPADMRRLFSGSRRGWRASSAGRSISSPRPRSEILFFRRASTRRGSRFMRREPRAYVGDMKQAADLIAQFTTGKISLTTCGTRCCAPRWSDSSRSSAKRWRSLRKPIPQWRRRSGDPGAHRLSQHADSRLRRCGQSPGLGHRPRHAARAARRRIGAPRRGLKSRRRWSGLRRNSDLARFSLRRGGSTPEGLWRARRSAPRASFAWPPAVARLGRERRMGDAGPTPTRHDAVVAWKLGIW